METNGKLHLESSVSSTATEINTWLVKAWTANDRLSVIWKSDLTDKIKRSFFSKQRSCRYCYRDALHGRQLNVWRKSLSAITQEICEQYWTSPGSNKPQNSSCTAIIKTIKVRQTRHAGHCWRSKDELISDIILWTPSHRGANVGRPSRTCIQQLCVSRVYSVEDLPGAMDDRDGWRARVGEIRAGRSTWWWYIHI